MKLLLFLSLTIINFFIVTILYFEIKKLKQKKLFTQIYKNYENPACLINNKTNKILWINNSFKNQFPSILISAPFSSFSISQIFNKIQINYNSTNWITSEIKFESISGFVFMPTQSLKTSIFLELPFATAIIDQNNKLIKFNETFADLIESDSYDSKAINTILNQLKERDEAIWQTKEGLQPIKTCLKTLDDNKILFLDNSIEMLKLKRKAQESQHLQILGQLTSSIIHDFKNLLTSICGFAESLEDQIPNNSSLEQIKRNITQAENLLKELLNFIKEKPVENQYIEPKKTLPQLCEMIKKLLGSRIKLETNINTNGFIKISETQLERILFNMVVNSKDAMQKGGIFKINTYKQEFTSFHKITEHQTLNPGNYYVIEVSDTGSGISAEYANKIFTPFFTTKNKGTGLGLASSLTLAVHYGGGINFDTSQNGTTFYIILPLLEKLPNDYTIKKTNTRIDKEKSAPSSTESSEQINQKLRKMQKIILVEDEETIRNLVKKTLIGSYEVSAFSEGMSALEAINTTEFDCLITDAVLPGADGIELANAAFKKNSKAKIALVSGYDFNTLEQNIDQELKSKINYIGKPFTLKKLKEKINEIMENNED